MTAPPLTHTLSLVRAGDDDEATMEAQLRRVDGDDDVTNNTNTSLKQPQQSVSSKNNNHSAASTTSDSDTDDSLCCVTNAAIISLPSSETATEAAKQRRHSFRRQNKLEGSSGGSGSGSAGSKESVGGEDGNKFSYRLKLPAKSFSRDQFSIWHVLRQCIGKVGVSFFLRHAHASFFVGGGRFSLPALRLGVFKPRSLLET